MKDNLNLDSDMLRAVSNPNITNPIIDIAIIKNDINSCGIINKLVLDNTGSIYSLKDSTSNKLDGVNYNLTLGIPGLITTVNAVNSDKVLELVLSDSPQSNTNSFNCDNNLYTFKLSQIMNNIGDMTTLTPNMSNMGQNIPSGNGWNNLAHLKIIQKAYRIKRYGCRYVLFNFLINNIGQTIAQRVLLKDLIPSYLKLLNNGIFVKYDGYNTKHLESNNYKLNGQELLITLKDIPSQSEVSVSILCGDDSCSGCNQINIGDLVYVAYYGIDNATTPSSATKSRTVVVDQLSNIKNLC